MPFYAVPPAGIGIGTSIYIDKDAFRDDTTGELLGHEAVHILQAAAHGSLGGMLEAYRDNMNKMEAVAYRFGGGIFEQSEIGRLVGLDGEAPVFQRRPIRRKRWMR